MWNIAFLQLLNICFINLKGNNTFYQNVFPSISKYVWEEYICNSHKLVGNILHWLNYNWL
jgi:hypothetical protein